ncbi:MAG: RDD family protein [Planctomycetia bacterium]
MTPIERDDPTETEQPPSFNPYAAPDDDAAASTHQLPIGRLIPRFIGLFLDGIIVWPTIVVIAFSVGPVLGFDLSEGSRYLDGRTKPAGHFFSFLGYILASLYEIASVCSSKQAGFGKYWLGLYVADLQRRKIGPLRATVRYLVKVLSLTLLVGLPFLTVFFTPRRRALHDLIAGTAVYAGKPPSDPPSEPAAPAEKNGGAEPPL